jgi:hypothetical protein
MTRLLLETRPARPLEWLRAVHRAGLSRDARALALTLVIYADPDGTNVRPGDARLVDDLSEKTRLGKARPAGLRSIERWRAELKHAGLLMMTRRGLPAGRNGGQGRPAVWRLVVPVDNPHESADEPGPAELKDPPPGSGLNGTAPGKDPPHVTGLKEKTRPVGTKDPPRGAHRPPQETSPLKAPPQTLADVGSSLPVPAPKRPAPKTRRGAERAPAATETAPTTRTTPPASVLGADLPELNDWLTAPRPASPNAARKAAQMGSDAPKPLDLSLATPAAVRAATYALTRFAGVPTPSQDHAARTAAVILGDAASPPHNVGAYVTAAIKANPARYQPTGAKS